jgi:hypothetical protein
LQPKLFKKIYFLLFYFIICIPVVHSSTRPKGLPEYIASPHTVDWVWVEAADVVIPKDYMECMERFNGFFKFTRLDMVVRLFTWESCFNTNLCHKNSDGTFDMGISAINSSNLNPEQWGFIDRYWKPYFPNITFDWRNPEHNMFMGMAYFRNCLNYSGNYFDAIICYNWGMGSYKNVYMKDYAHCKLPSATKNIIEFVYAKDFWNDNLNKHYLSTVQKEKLKDAKRRKGN